MKKFVFYIFVSVLSNNIFSQTICVSTENVKVLYIGLENELLITTGNVEEKNVHVSTNNGTIRKIGYGKYITTPVSSGNSNITVRAGDKTEVFTIRVRTVPDPIPMVGTSTGGRIPSNLFKAQQGIRANLQNFFFDDFMYNVVSYTFYASGAGFNDSTSMKGVPVLGNSFEPIRHLLNRCRPGTSVILDEIIVEGSDRSKRKLGGMTFYLY